MTTTYSTKARPAAGRTLYGGFKPPRKLTVENLLDEVITAAHLGHGERNTAVMTLKLARIRGLCQHAKKMLEGAEDDNSSAE